MVLISPRANSERRLLRVWAGGMSNPSFPVFCSYVGSRHLPGISEHPLSLPPESLLPPQPPVSGSLPHPSSDSPHHGLSCCRSP